MKNSRSREWSEQRSLEDLQALLIDIDEERRLIKRMAWEIGQTEIFQASERQRAAIEKFKRQISQKWYLLAELE